MVKYIQHGPELKYQLSQAYKDDSGFDLCAQIDDKIVMEPGAIAEIDTGIQLMMPLEMEGQIRPRSGLAKKKGVTVLNAPGTIDNGYEGTVKVLLINHGKSKHEVYRGDRIAQVVFAIKQRIDIIDEHGKRKNQSSRTRGVRGFGSSGPEYNGPDT